eukprot:scaffold10737_cov133-Isochrysis_galbana.AAC.3
MAHLLKFDSSARTYVQKRRSKNAVISMCCGQRAVQAPQAGGYSCWLRSSHLRGGVTSSFGLSTERHP